MTTKRNSLAMLFLLAAILAVLFLAAPAHAQNVSIDMTTACGGGSCYNVGGLFTNGTSFLGTLGMDNGQSNGCTTSGPCPAAYSATTLGLTLPTPPGDATLTVGGVPFDFGVVNTTSCGASTCINDVLQVPNASSGTTLTVTPAIYSTVIMLGAAVNGHHEGSITINYSDGTSDPAVVQTFSDWCGAAAGGTETLAVGSIKRINAQGSPIGPNCNLYQYTYPTNISKMVSSITIGSADDCSSNGIPSCTYVLAVSLKPPTYTIAGGAASPTSVPAGGTATATITVNPQPGYTGTITFNDCSSGITPTIVGDPPSAATAPTCSFSSPTVTVTSGAAPPTATLTFNAAAATKGAIPPLSKVYYAIWLSVPGLVLAGLGSRSARRQRLFGLLVLGLTLAAVVAIPGCVSYTHVGNVGTPPGQYTVSITGSDQNGLTQASNPAGTSNTVVITVTD